MYNAPETIVARPQLRIRPPGAGRSGKIHRAAEPAVAPARPVSLGLVLQMALELNRNTAERHGVRVHGYSADQRLRQADETALLGKIDTILSRTIRAAQWGSLMVVQVSAVRDVVQLQIGFARPVANSASDIGNIDWVEETWSWKAAEAEPVS